MRFRNAIALLLSGWIVIASLFQPLAAQTEQAPTPVVSESPDQLQQLVAPIALYPDKLVAQILAAATYPTEVVEADRWLQENSNLKGQKLAQAVNKQAWDPSVKALTQFPSVLANMDKNLSWTSSLGDAYVNQPQQVMDAVQAMRHRAQQAGDLKSTPQQTVKSEGQTLVIEPAEPDVVYVPEYDPWLVYGAIVPAWPGWYAYPGLYVAGPGIVFGLGFGLGFFGGFAWGWNHWGFDWAHRTVVFNHATYISHSNSFINRNRFIGHSTFAGHNTFANHGAFNHNTAVSRAGASAFRGFNHGEIAMSHSFRGRSSFGGGFHGASRGGRR